jgi:hypothetical protein
MRERCTRGNEGAKSAQAKRGRAGFTLDASYARRLQWAVESIMISRPQVFASKAAVCKSPSATPADPCSVKLTGSGS